MPPRQRQGRSGGSSRRAARPQASRAGARQLGHDDAAALDVEHVVRPAGGAAVGQGAAAGADEGQHGGARAADDGGDPVGAQPVRPGRATRASPARAAPGGGSRGWRRAGARADRPGRRPAARPGRCWRPRRRAAPRRAAGRGRPRSPPGWAGTKTSARTRGSTAEGTAYHSPASRPQITKPPSRAGATLSGWPSRSAASRSRDASSSSSWPPATRARASATPATIAADDDPRPRLCGMTLRHVRRSPGGRASIASNAACIARTTRWEARRAARRRRPRR